MDLWKWEIIKKSGEIALEASYKFCFMKSCMEYRRIILWILTYWCQGKASGTVSIPFRSVQLFSPNQRLRWVRFPLLPFQSFQANGIILNENSLLPFHALSIWLFIIIYKSPCFNLRSPQSVINHSKTVEVVGLERGPLSLVSKIEELLERKSIGSGLESREYGRTDPSRWQLGTLYPQKLALTSPTSGGHSVGIGRSRTKATEFIYLLLLVVLNNIQTFSSYITRNTLRLRYKEQPVNAG
jgi:hypothetical protein